MLIKKSEKNVRTAALALAAVCVLTAAGCGNTPAQTTTTTQAEAADTQSDAANTSDSAEQTDGTSGETDNAVTDDSEKLNSLLEANSTIDILMRHSNVRASSTTGTETVEGVMRYMSDNVYVIQDDQGNGTYADKEKYLFIDDYNTGSVSMIVAPAIDYMNSYAAERSQLAPAIYDTETLISLEESDGKITAVIEDSNAEFAQGIVEHYIPGLEYAEGMLLHTKMVFDAENGDLLEIISCIVGNDSVEHVFSTETYSYDVDEFDIDSEESLFKVYNSGKEIGKCDVVFGPGTDGEMTVSFVRREGVKFVINYDFNLIKASEYYSDPGLTTKYEELPEEGDITIYVDISNFS